MLSVEDLCRETGVSRAGFYRHWQQREPDIEEMELREQLQQLALRHRSYGYRRLTALLRSERGVINGKRVRRLLQEDNLLSVRKRRFVVTTEGRHTWRVWPNLARWVRPDGPDQLWVADITYLRLKEEFIYLAVILDVWSRRVVGWAVRSELDTHLTIEALKMALTLRQPQLGLVHHSDRGVQYASADYIQLLDEHGIEISMSRPGNPYDNAFCESFLGKLKQEQWTDATYRSIEEAKPQLSLMLEKIYNQERIHSALGYMSPVEFERRQAASSSTARVLQGGGHCAFPGGDPSGRP